MADLFDLESMLSGPVLILPPYSELLREYVTDVEEALPSLRREHRVRRIKREMILRRLNSADCGSGLRVSFEDTVDNEHNNNNNNNNNNDRQAAISGDTDTHNTATYNALCEDALDASSRKVSVTDDDDNEDDEDERRLFESIGLLESSQEFDLSSVGEERERERKSEQEREHLFTEEHDEEEKLDEEEEMKKNSLRARELCIETTLVVPVDGSDGPMSRLTVSSAGSPWSPIVSYVRYPVRTRATRRGHRRSASESANLSSPSHTYSELGESVLIEEEIFWEFKLPSLAPLTSGAMANQYISSNSSVASTGTARTNSSSSVNKLFFFGNRLWRLAFGQHNIDCDYYYVFLSLAELSNQDCYLHAEFSLHAFHEEASDDEDDELLYPSFRSIPNKKKAREKIPPFTRMSSRSYFFPAGAMMSRGFEKFICVDDLEEYVSKTHLQPRVRMSIAVKARHVLADNRLLPLL